MSEENNSSNEKKVLPVKVNDSLPTGDLPPTLVEELQDAMNPVKGLNIKIRS